MKKILVVEPYMGGSHGQFISGLMEHVPGDYTVLRLSDRSWKTKMQLAAGWCVAELLRRNLQNLRFDLVFCSTFVDLAVLRALLGRQPWWNGKTEFFIYFHENQIAYPGPSEQHRNFQFALINFNSALAADSIAFNSHYNQQTFIDGCSGYLRKFSEFGLEWAIEEIKTKSIVLNPPLSFGHIDRFVRERTVDIPVVVWNHRWEYDKGIEKFYEIMKSLKENGSEFRLILLGKAHRNALAIEKKFKETFSREIVHCGYAESPERYGELLSCGDIVVSTASHEFFGIAVAEAIRAGCLPVLPNDLAYKEMYPARYLYEKGGCLVMLQKRLSEKRRLTSADSGVLTDRFTWRFLRKEYVRWLTC